MSVSDGVHTSYTRIKVDVILANRHAPEFTRAIYDVNFEENSPPGSLVATVLATDNDRGSFGQVEYDIQSDHLLDYFAIDSETGIVFLNVSREFLRIRRF